MRAALLVIDMQAGFARRIAEGRATADPAAIANMARLLAAFRAAGLPVLHVHHDAADPAASWRLDGPDGVPIPETAPAAAEPVFVKSGSSGFAGTGLAAHLAQQGIGRLVVCGGAANYCVSSTVRSAADLGVAVDLVADGLLCFDAEGPGGRHHSAADVLSMTLAVLGSDFARLRSAADLPDAG